MRIVYVNHARFPIEKAHGNQIAHVCAALGELGHDVTLACPTVRNIAFGDPYAYYGVAKNFAIAYVSHWDAQDSPFVPGALRFALNMQFYARALPDFLRNRAPDCLYVRSPVLLAALVKLDFPVILELHSLPRYRRARFARLCNRCCLVVCLTAAMRQELLMWGVQPDHVIVEGDGVDLDRFSSLPPSAEAKKRWNLPSGRPIIGYAGSLATHDTREKGVAELIAAFARLRDRKIAFFGWIVGGPEHWKKHYEQKAHMLGLTAGVLRFEGMIAPVDIPSALVACDVCVYPAPASQHPYFQRDTSPLKLFEYLAAGTPVVCADLLPLREVLDASVVRFCPPGDPSGLSEALADVLAHPDEAAARAMRGKEFVRRHSWRERMQRILKKVLQENEQWTMDN